MVKLLAGAPEPMSKNAIETDPTLDHSRQAIRAAIGMAVKGQVVKVVADGTKNAKRHSIAYPCAECGMPVASKRDRHQVCPPDTEIEGLL